MTGVRVEPADCEFPTKWARQSQSFERFEMEMCQFRPRPNPQKGHVAISPIRSRRSTETSNASQPAGSSSVEPK